MALSARQNFLSQSEIQKRCANVASQLRTLCAGLIKVQRRKGEGTTPKTTVTFAHKIVKDNLMKRETQQLLRQQTRDSQFNPNFAILKATILLLKAQRQASSSDRLSYRHIEDGILYARRTEAEMGGSVAVSQHIDELADTGQAWFRLNTLSQPIFHPGCTKYSVASQCGLQHYLRYLPKQDNTIPKENSRNTSKRTLLSFTLLPPSGFERFVSPQVVETLVEFGSDVAEAVQLAVSFLENWDPEQRKPFLIHWTDLLKSLMSKQRHIYQGDVDALQKVYENRPDEWMQIQRSIESAGARLKKSGSRRGASPSKSYWWTLFVF